MIKIDIGVAGLSIIGRSLALNMADHGFEVRGYSRSAAAAKQVVQEHPHENLVPFYDLEALISSLTPPKGVVLMIQTGKPVGAVIGQLAPLLGRGDIVTDGGNSFYGDAMRRARELEERGIHYLSVGISGGEEGARFGPSIMPGGNGEAYESVRPILEIIVARAIGEPCCAYIGPGGTRHYVKIVHDGTEYADMQLIAESYLLLKYVSGSTSEELADTFHSWDQGELHSYLIGITTDIFREQGNLGQDRLIDSILDSAKQKGTGRWTNIEALKQGVDISIITSACTAHIMSNRLESRKRAVRLIPSLNLQVAQDKETFAHTVRATLCTGKIIAYAQGFALMQDTSNQYGWNLDLGRIAAILRAGCTIQATFLNDITHASGTEDEPENLIFDTFFLSRVNEHQDSLHTAVSTDVLNGLPVPALCNAVSCLDVFRVEATGANLIQAQRDCSDTHTYERTDCQGTFHHQWKETDEN